MELIRVILSLLYILRVCDMKYIKQLCIILLVSFIGELMSYYIPFPVPASIYGILLMFIALETKIIRLSSVKEVGSFLTGIMQVMFIPAAAGLLNSWGLIKEAWLQYIILIAVTTVAVMAVSGLVTQFIIRRGAKKNV